MKKIVENSHSITEVLRKLNKFPNSRNIKKLRNEISELGISTGHFTANGSTPTPILKKVCPVCNIEFEVSSKGRVSKQTTCSHGCSNVYFQKQKKFTTYRAICFKNHEKKCVCCEERKIVEAHHYDENEKNNHPSNLIPLCPTHHQYWHSRYRQEVKPTIDKFREDFLRKS